MAPEAPARDWWTWRAATDEPLTIDELKGRLRWWLRQYHRLPEDIACKAASCARYGGDGPPVTLPGSAHDLALTRADLDGLLARLEPRQREALRRCCVDGQSARAAAVAMHGSFGATRALIETGLRDLARALLGS